MEFLLHSGEYFNLIHVAEVELVLWGANVCIMRVTQ